MTPFLSSRLLYLCWTAAAVLSGGILMSFHMPFEAPGDEILTLAPAASPGHWREIHFLAASCGCSGRVLRQLAGRKPHAGVEEQVVLLDGPETPAPDTSSTIEHVSGQGFPVTHIDSETIPKNIGLVGVPLLVILSPEGKILYRGGYGPLGDQETNIFTALRAGKEPQSMPLMGCAVSQRLRARVDPFHLKYRLP